MRRLDQRVSIFMAFLALAGCRPRTEASRPEILVAAASSTAPAFAQLAAAYEKQSGRSIRFTFGSSGLLAKQLSQGAPFDVFAAADGESVDEAIASGACDGATKKPYARGQLVVWARNDLAAAPHTLAEFSRSTLQKIAIANPAHAPYGKAAKQALQAAGVWTQLEGKLVYGENVRQTLQYAASGNAEVALVALSLVVADKENPWWIVDASMHDDLNQFSVVCTHGQQTQAGRHFAAFLTSPTAREILGQHGLASPRDATPP